MDNAYAIIVHKLADSLLGTTAFDEVVGYFSFNKDTLSEHIMKEFGSIFLTK